MKVKNLETIPEKVEKELKKFSPFLRRLFFNRGVKTEKEAEEFLNPLYEKSIFDPLTMKGVSETRDRLYKAFKENEKVVVYADYDCDGIPAATVLTDLFKKVGFENFEVYIPDRHKEGYGLKKDVLKRMSEEKVSLVITVDLGITNVEEVAYAKELGMDIIVTDHHLCLEELPPADVIVNPKQKDCEYGDPMLCGCGVAFKIVQAFVDKYGEEFKIHKGWEKWLLDLVGLSTLSDMVPLVNENRTLAYYGMKVLQKTKRHGFREIFAKNRLNPRFLEEDDITFTVSPRLNAAGRMDHPKRAFELLSADTEQEARSLALVLEELNNTRKKLTASTTKHAKAKIEKQKHGDVIVLGDPSWSIGILGLVASKLVEEYGKPAFVWGGEEDSDVLKGSCRSDGSVHLVDLMSAISKESFLGFGGHKAAGGFSVSKKNIHSLEDKLNEAFKKTENKESVSKEIYIDDILTLDDVTVDRHKELRQLAPFGVGNQKPVFLFDNLELVDFRNFGKTKNHLELTFENSKGLPVKVIQFFKTIEDISEDLNVGDKISVVGSLFKSFFSGSLDLKVRADYIVKK